MNTACGIDKYNRLKCDNIPRNIPRVSSKLLFRKTCLVHIPTQRP